MTELDRAGLVTRLAEVSHKTWMRQKAEELACRVDDLAAEVTEHDRERAEDTARELEKLGLWPPQGA